MQDRDVVGAGRDDRQFVVHVAQVQLTHCAGVALLDQKAAAALVQRGDHLEFAFGQLESVDVILAVGIRIGQQDQRGCLFDQCGGDVAAQGVFRGLGSKDAKPVLIADCFMIVEIVIV